MPMESAVPIQLDVDERRIIGVLIEKSLTTPSYYPMTVNALVAGANQKSGRDPICEYVDDEVAEILERLQKRSLVTVIHSAGSRTERWRQELTKLLELDGQEMAVIGELLLRGAQTVGDLRARASRMKEIADQDALAAVLERLTRRAQPLILRLTPEGVRRGIRVTHALYPADELARLRAAEDALEGPPADTSSSQRSASGGGLRSASQSATQSASLESDLDALRRRVENIERHLGLHPPG